MKDFGDMHMATEVLTAAGFPGGETAKLIGGNFLAFWKRAAGN